MAIITCSMWQCDKTQLASRLYYVNSKDNIELYKLTEYPRGRMYEIKI